MHVDDSTQERSEFEEALHELSSMLVEEYELDSMLRRVTELAASIGDCDSASVSLFDEGEASTSAATDERTIDVDRAQFAADAGPCLEAYRTGHIQRVVVEEAQERWPAFTAAAQPLGIRSFLAVPLTVHDHAIGALNMFSSQPHGFGDFDDGLATRFAAQASVVVQNARLYRSAVTLANQLTEAMASRAAIEQAKGVLMARHHVDADTAFGLLRAQSQRENRKIRDLVQDVLASTARS